MKALIIADNLHPFDNTSGARNWWLDAVLNSSITSYDQIGTSLLPQYNNIDNYDIVIIPSDQTTQAYGNINSYSNQLEDYVEDGGVLSYGVAGYGWRGGTPPSQINIGNTSTRVTADFQNDCTIHSNTSFSSFTSVRSLNASVANHVHLSGSTAGPNTSMEVLSSTQNNLPTTIRYEVGQGDLIVTGLTLESPNNSQNWRPFYSDYLSYLESLVQGNTTNVVPTPVPSPTPVPTPSPTPVNAVCDYLSFAPDAQFQRPFDATAKYFDYVDRYPLTLKTAFVAANKAGTAPSQALWGQQHWLAAGSKQGRVLEIVTGLEDTNDYGAYVENYGTTLLDIYRASPDSNPASDTFKSLFNWGKDHYNTVGKAAGREIGGGVDWGAIVKQNFDLYTKWQDAQITSPGLSAFAYGYRNQNVIKSANGVQVGRDTQEKLTGQYAYGLGGNDVLTGTANDDLLHGGFGDDLICHGNGGTDLVYGGPGKDVFKLHSGGTLNIRDFRKGTDFIQLGDGMTDADVQLVFDGFNNSTSFKKGSETLASVYGTNPNDFSFAQQSEGLDNVFIA